MPDPICRWRNSSIKQVLEFNSLFPLTQSEKNAARKLVEKRWNILGGDNFFTTPYQLAAQMGIYYEDDLYLYPKFSKLISPEEAHIYMSNWGKKYYAPNPYTKSLQLTKQPVILNNYLVNLCLDKPGAKLTDALTAIFNESIGNTDILVNMLNNFSEVSIIDGIVTLKKDAPTIKYDEVFLEIDKSDKKFFFEFLTSNIQADFINDFSKAFGVPRIFNQPLQQIFYGAPGTGKSNTVKQVTDGQPKENVFRTTFHPDSDYSTFVGCYKPSMGKAKVYGPQGVVQVGGTDVEKDEITYKFVPQAFVNAYVRAYHTEDPVFLVIEEINRGNCAQIFGDMFQLLDRNAETGESDYAIKPDTDLQHYLCSVMGDALTDCVEIQSGEEMRLPSNLYIWATMNTSDQSLFPIDSAFKRRWDWKYIPIADAGKGYRIEVGGRAYDWWDFLEKINAEIGEVTSSEDKMLGYFFAKAKDGKVTADMFVSKVLFYLWNDVFKDFGTDRPLFEKGKNDKDNTVYLSFKDFFKPNGDVNEENVIRLLDNLKVKVCQEAEEDDDGNTPSTDASKRNYDKYSVNGEGAYGKNRLAEACVKKYIELHSEKSADEVVTEWKTLGEIVSHFIETEEKFNARTDNSKDRSTRVECNGSALYVVHSGYGADNGKADVLMNAVNSKDWGITIEKL